MSSHFDFSVIHFQWTSSYVCSTSKVSFHGKRIFLSAASLHLFASMNHISILRPVSSFFFFFLLHQTPMATSETPYKPKDSIFLNCGSSSNAFGWTGELDSRFVLIEPPNNKSINSTAVDQVSSGDSVPYMTARISRSQFTYSFSVTAGQKFIRLYFYPAAYQGGYDRRKDFFNVEVGAFTLMWNFSASLYAELWATETFFKEYCVNVDENQRLNVSFSAFPSASKDSYAFINGIEIVSMPTNFYYTPPEGPGLKFIGQNRKFYLQNDTALENMCRLNVGGSPLSPKDDSGMNRTWQDEGNYLVKVPNAPLHDARYPETRIKHSRIPPYTAPDDVYKSAKVMGRNKSDNLLNNLTWWVPVDQGFTYLVRLHFCEIPETKSVGVRRFDILIDNQTAETSFDVFESSGGNGIPIYKDYIVTCGRKGVKLDYTLFIALHPDVSSLFQDVILNALKVYKLSDNGGSLAISNPEIPVLPSTPPSPSPVQYELPATNNSSSKKKLLIAVFGSVGVLLILLSLTCCIVVWHLRKRKHYGSYYESLACCCSWCFNPEKERSLRKSASSLPHERCRHLSLVEIKNATNNFHENLIIGEGGFGKVYKGEIENEVIVAIKRLNPESKQGFQEFKTEIEMLSQLRHVHLVSLIGYCVDEGEMILVYEYMINGTLQSHLYGTNNDPLPWKQRLEICVGAASGLDYLHTGVARTVIHRDVKTTNILLDEKWVAKVSDFGLSRTGVNDTAVSTLVKGTWGYLDPEYARRQQLTDKSDVYSFGVVLFEVLCARKPLSPKLEEQQRNLANWARKCIQNGTVHQIIDPHLTRRIAPECFNKFVEIAESCVRDQGNERPTMHDVMEKLKFALELQEAADAEKEQENPKGEYFYSEISFQAPQYTNAAGRSEIDSSSVSGLSTLSTNTTGLTSPSLGSISITPSLDVPSIDTTDFAA